MKERFTCPYCGHRKKSDVAGVFSSCRFCGLKSALVKMDDGALIIVDRRMPFLKRRCEELSEKHPSITVIVDRRIAQDPFSDDERRVSLQEGERVY